MVAFPIVCADFFKFRSRLRSSLRFRRVIRSDDCTQIWSDIRHNRSSTFLDVRRDVFAKYLNASLFLFFLLKGWSLVFKAKHYRRLYVPVADKAGVARMVLKPKQLVTFLFYCPLRMSSNSKRESCAKTIFKRKTINSSQDLAPAVSIGVGVASQWFRSSNQFRKTYFF